MPAFQVQRLCLHCSTKTIQLDEPSEEILSAPFSVETTLLQNPNRQDRQAHRLGSHDKGPAPGAGAALLVPRQRGQKLQSALGPVGPYALVHFFSSAYQIHLDLKVLGPFS